jgi:hypothetical protein
MLVDFLVRQVSSVIFDQPTTALTCAARGQVWRKVRTRQVLAFGEVSAGAGAEQRPNEVFINLTSSPPARRETCTNLSISQKSASLDIRHIQLGSPLASPVAFPLDGAWPISMPLTLCQYLIAARFVWKAEIWMVRRAASYPSRISFQCSTLVYHVLCELMIRYVIIYKRREVPSSSRTANSKAVPYLHFGRSVISLS